MIKDNIFKAYDVRGIYPNELNEEAATTIGLAIADLVSGGRVVVARDMRVSSLSLHQSLIKGLCQGGAQVDDLELMPIDAVYYAVGKFGYDAGIMVTASHNPPEYNGFKIVTKGVEVLRGSEVAKLINNTSSTKDSIPGEASEKDIWSDYLTHLRSFVDINQLKPLKVVVDAGNGLAGLVIPKLFVGLPFELTPLSFELDGTFPNRPSNPLAQGAPDRAADLVKKVGAQVGIMFDGDTDRVFFLTETGAFVPADVTLLLLAKEFLRRQPGSAIAYNLICSRAVPEFISAWGGRPIRSAVGYVNVRQALLKEGAVMGGELSAHYSFRDNYSSDSGFIAALVVLELLSRLEQPLSELVREYAPYAKSPEINLEVANKSEVLSKIKNNFVDARIDEVDGVTVAYDNWWCNVRPSNTEPLLRVTVEAATAELLKTKQAEVLKIIKES